jgi:hypothetical protein
VDETPKRSDFVRHDSDNAVIEADALKTAHGSMKKIIRAALRQDFGNFATRNPNHLNQ